MKFTINRELLLSTLQNVSRGLSDKKPFPVLTGIQITVHTDKIVFVTTNKDISVQIILERNDEVVIEEPGACVVPGKYFLEIVKKLEGKDVEFTLFESTTIKILSERSDFTLVTYDNSLFPVINFEPNVPATHLEATTMKEIIKQVSFAAATVETRLILTSVNFKFAGNTLDITATDSYRLAKKRMTFDDLFDSNIVNIPSKSLDELNKILEDSHEDVEMYVIEKNVIFKYRNVTFITRLVEGIYPDTSTLFPKEVMLSIKFNRMELLAAVDRASLFIGTDNLSVVKLNISPNKAIEVSSNTSEIGKVVEEIYPLEVSDQLDFQIAFSSKYLADALKSFESQTITIKFTGEIKPALISGEKEQNLIQLLLPVRVF
ncbi:MAG: DNA polymerase III subunit beta [Bacilli bacterium]|nr:DNA polymerase III subunit beta [Bacilli bacterium]MDY4052659.1 DNA polymerase III subunit beta [Bacilli bacterium]